MTRQAGGWIWLVLTPERCEALELPAIADDEAHMVTVEAARGVTTGISTADQAHTMRTVADPRSTRDDLVVPGHVRPLRARAGGVLERAGHAEAGADLARLAGLEPAVVVCEILDDRGALARGSDVTAFAARHGLRVVTVADVVARRRSLVERVVATALPTAFGTFTVVGYRALLDGSEHVALVKGDVDGAEDVPVRVHVQCVTGDVFHALRCDCRARLEHALETIEAEGRGVVVYLAEGRDQLAEMILADLGVRAWRDAGYSRSSTMALAMPPASQTA
jgi:3,4-dihydroxy 2-butanone 4-phosphate synthase/GTP cyclohydrolase II